MNPNIIAYCILGSNQGPRAATLRRAVFLLADAPRVDVLQTSSVYETEPWGRTDQPRYLNAAVELRTSLEPEELLDCFQAVERRLGRGPSEERWGPRPIDLDLALYGDRIVETPRLTVPHRHLAERAFALAPLLEIAPDICRPVEKDGESPDDATVLLEGEPYALALQRLGPQAADSHRPVGKLALSLASPCDKPGEHAPAVDPRLPAEESLLFLSRSQEETERLSEALGRRMQGGEALALVGNLGAGKTCFARGIARGLDIPGNITSPSYVLVKSYEGRLAFHHADFYRLAETASPVESDDASGKEELDLATLGLEDYLENPEAVVLVEWADHFPNWLEPPFYLVEITGRGDSPRAIHLRRVAGP